jgi:hypothetical protein
MLNLSQKPKEWYLERQETHFANNPPGYQLVVQFGTTTQGLWPLANNFGIDNKHTFYSLKKIWMERIIAMKCDDWNLEMNIICKWSVWHNWFGCSAIDCRNKFGNSSAS